MKIAWEIQFKMFKLDYSIRMILNQVSFPLKLVYLVQAWIHPYPQAQMCPSHKPKHALVQANFPSCLVKSVIKSLLATIMNFSKLALPSQSQENYPQSIFLKMAMLETKCLELGLFSSKCQGNAMFSFHCNFIVWVYQPLLWPYIWKLFWRLK